MDTDRIMGNAFHISAVLLKTSLSISRRFVANLWPDGIEPDRSSLLIGEISLFTAWSFDRHVPVPRTDDVMKKAEHSIAYQNVRLALLNDDNTKERYAPRKHLYESLTSKPVLDALGHGEPLTAAVRFIVDDEVNTGALFLEETVDPRHLIPYINSPDGLSRSLALVFFAARHLAQQTYDIDFVHHDPETSEELLQSMFHEALEAADKVVLA